MKRSWWIVAALVLWPVAARAKERSSADMSGKREQAMKNCPSAVPGASTQVINRKDGVEVTITANEPTATEEIRRRAKIQENVAAQPARGAIEHTGTGTGSGRYGFCPGGMQYTKLVASDVPGGVTLRIQAERPGDVAKLQKTSHQRAEALRVRQ
jgi:hypothetical protein